MELKARFTELNQEYGYGYVIGEKNFGDIEESAAHQKAAEYRDMLAEVRNTEVSYVLESENKTVLAYLDLKDKKKVTV